MMLMTLMIIPILITDLAARWRRRCQFESFQLHETYNNKKINNRLLIACKHAFFPMNMRKRRQVEQGVRREETVGYGGRWLWLRDLEPNEHRTLVGALSQTQSRVVPHEAAPRHTLLFVVIDEGDASGQPNSSASYSCLLPALPPTNNNASFMAARSAIEVQVKVKFLAALRLSLSACASLYIVYLNHKQRKEKKTYQISH